MTSAALLNVEIPLEMEIEKMFQAGLPVESVIVFMQEAGLSMIPSIKMVRKYLHVTLGQAQDIVHDHSVWYGQQSVAVLESAASVPESGQEASMLRKPEVVSQALKSGKTSSQAQGLSMKMENLVTR